MSSFNAVKVCPVFSSTPILPSNQKDVCHPMRKVKLPISSNVHTVKVHMLVKHPEDYAKELWNMFLAP